MLPYPTNVSATRTPVDAARVTVIVYTRVVPSWAMASTVTRFDPWFRLIDKEALPLATGSPLTFAVAVASASVGVTVTELVTLVTASV